MKTSKNEHTGDSLKSKQTNDKYREGWDRIFNKEDTTDNKYTVVSYGNYSICCEDKETKNKTIKKLRSAIKHTLKPIN